MNQERFEQLYRDDWNRFEAWLQARRRKERSELSANAVPRLYRRLCHHLALARERGYTAELVDRLHQWVLEGHQQLYGARSRAPGRLLAFVTSDFPTLIRTEWRVVLAATLLFYGPLFLMFAAVQWAPELIFTVVGADQVAEMEAMYDPANEVLGRERGSDSDFMMFGFYIQNNIGIAFQTFAGGMVFTLGTIFYLLMNGLFIGAVAAHLTTAGYSETFYSFVIGHSALELTAITFAGAAGLKLGLALLHPAPYRRVDALKRAARTSIGIVYGAGIMLLLAAFVEAYWSSSRDLPLPLKYAVGSAWWLLLALYIARAGRPGRAA